MIDWASIPGIAGIAAIAGIAGDRQHRGPGPVDHVLVGDFGGQGDRFGPRPLDPLAPAHRQRAGAG